MSVRVEVAVPASARVGEGPFHDDGSLLWVDIPAGHVHHTDLASGTTRTDVVDTMVGAAVPARRGLVAATREGFASVVDGTLTTRAAVLPAGERMNDAKCDPSGRFWAGSTEMDFTDGAGRLWVLDADWNAHCVLDDLALPNGIGWSPDGRTLYLVDSTRHELWSFDAPGPAATALGGRRLLHSFADDGVPDGLAVDAAGCLWVAVWGASRLVRISPDGDELQRVELPVTQPSSCAFGGPGLEILYVTSAADGLDPGGPDGSVLAVHGLGVTGTPVSAFAG